MPYEKDFELYVEMLRKPSNQEWARDVINHFNEAVFGTSAGRNELAPSTDSNDTEVQAVSWEDEMMAQLAGHASGRHEPVDVPVDVPAVNDPPAENLLSFNWHRTGPTIHTPMDAPARLPANIPSISGAAMHTAGQSVAVPTTFAPNPHPDGVFVQAGTNPQRVLPTTVLPSQSVTMSAISQVQIPLAGLSLSSSSSGTQAANDSPIDLPVIIPSLVSVPSAKARAVPKKGKATARDQANQANAGGVQGTGVPGRATRSRAKQS